MLGAVKFILPFFCFLLTLSSLKSSNNLIFNRLQESKKGDFVVYEEGKSVHLLTIQHIDQEYAIFEEIVAPRQLLQKQGSPVRWADWVLNHAPGHTSWIALEINLQKLEITECFSFSRDCWLSLSSSESMIHHLLNLNLSPIKLTERKKVGPPPKEGTDLRKLWNPPITIGGQKIVKAEASAYSATWPSDGSPLAGKIIDLYFCDNTPEFPFPHWLQVRDDSKGHFKLRSIDAGSGIVSPYEGMPRRIPEFIVAPKRLGNTIEFLVKIPPYYQDIRLFAIDESVNRFETIELPFEKSEAGKELFCFVVKSHQMIPDHQYSFFLTAEKPMATCVDAMGKILWK